MNGSKHGEGAKRSANILASFRPANVQEIVKKPPESCFFTLYLLSTKTILDICDTDKDVYYSYKDPHHGQYLVTYYDVCWSEGDISLSLSRNESTRTYAHVKSRLIAFDRRVEPPKTRSLAKVTWLPNGRPLTSLSLHVVMASTERLTF